MKDISYLLAQYDNKTTLGKESLLGSIIFLTDRDHIIGNPYQTTLKIVLVYLKIRDS